MTSRGRRSSLAVRSVGFRIGSFSAGTFSATFLARGRYVPHTMIRQSIDALRQSRSLPFRSWSAFASLVSLALTATHCGSSSDVEPCVGSACTGTTSDAGTGTDGGNAPVPPTCDLSKSLRDSPDCVRDSVAVFVSPSGKDGAAGTKSDPLRTIAQGIAAAKASGRPRVYVCEGIYDTPVTITQSIALHGGLSCAWAIKPDALPKVSPAKGIALTVDKVTGAVVLEDFEIVGSSDPNAKGESAIAVFVTESKNVTFRRSTITSRSGQPGAKGITRSNHSAGPAMIGTASNGGDGGAERVCSCLDGKTSSTGGRGATANSAMLTTSGSATPSVGGINEGGTGSSSCAPGNVGENGGSGAKGAGSVSPGALTTTGWSTASLGTAGAGGNPGQGGGGGGAINNSSQGGAGGGCGGCGGGGGDPGGNGGSSFALLSFESTVVLSGATLAAGSAGKGGDGGDGQDGQDGGGPGSAVACAGGTGGIGAGGAGGGGGAGGHSAAIAYKGAAPRLEDGTTTTVGSSAPMGAGGAGGRGGGTSGPVGDPGIAGIAQASFPLP